MEMEVEELSRAERKFVEKSQTPWLKRCISLSYGIEIMGYSRSPLESTFEARQFEKKILFVGRFLRDSTHLPTHAKFGAVPGDGAEGLWEENGRKNEEN